LEGGKGVTPVASSQERGEKGEREVQLVRRELGRRVQWGGVAFVQRVDF